MDIKDIQNLIRFVSKADVAEVNIKNNDFEIKIKTLHSGTAQQTFIPQQQLQQAPMLQVQPVEVVAAAVAEEKEKPSKLIEVKSPMIGTFYRSSSPDKAPFVSVGDRIELGGTICVIEAMKLFNEIESEVSGKIVEILVDNATPVEYDQPLFLVDPS